MSKASILNKLDEGWFDLTHLEINTIIKPSMTATKASSRPRELLNQIAETYHDGLVKLGAKYQKNMIKNSNVELSLEDSKNQIFGENTNYIGSGVASFKEMSLRAFNSIQYLDSEVNNISEKLNINKDDVLEDMSMLERIKVNADEIKNLLVRHKNQYTPQFDITYKEKTLGGEDSSFYETKYKAVSKREAKKFELHLSLDELSWLKKIYDVGFEKIITQTIVGLDGDVTTRIAKSFADKPNDYVNQLHQDSIKLSVNYWTKLVEIFSSMLDKVI